MGAGRGRRLRLTDSGQPNGFSNVGASGGDIDTAFAPQKSSSGTYRSYVASLSLGSVNVAVSKDNGVTFSQTPVPAGIPVGDRESTAAYGADTSLLTYHDIPTGNIDVLRSDNGGALYTQIARVIPDTDHKAQNNELGNIVIDHNHPTAGGFRAYQAFVAPSSHPGGNTSPVLNEAFLGRLRRRRQHLGGQADPVQQAVRRDRPGARPSTCSGRRTTATPGPAPARSARWGRPSSRGPWRPVRVRTWSTTAPSAPGRARSGTSPSRRTPARR